MEWSTKGDRVGTFATRSFLELQPGAKNPDAEVADEEFENELQQWWETRISDRKTKNEDELAEMNSAETKLRAKHTRLHLKHATRLSEKFLQHLAEVSSDPKKSEEGFGSQAMFERSKQKFLAAAKVAEASENDSDSEIETDKLKAFADKLQVHRESI